MVDAGRFREAIAKSGAELVLHGHNHFTNVATIAGRDGPVPVIGVAASSILPGEAINGGSYCLFEIGGDGGFSCRMSERAMVRAGARVETIREEVLR